MSLFYFGLLQNICMKIFKYILVWIEEQTYWIASRFLVLGFDLELYSTSEYCMVYWYIYVILIKLAEKTHFRLMASNENGNMLFQLFFLFFYFPSLFFLCVEHVGLAV